MTVVFANDGSRLARQVLLRQLEAAQLDELSAEDQHVFVQQIESFGDIVLFWHERAERAVDLLSRLASGGNWPRNLHGVVIFRAAAFAGQGSKEEADKLLKQYGMPPSKVHIFPLVVSDNPRPATVECILRFGVAVRSAQTVVPPFWMLSPEDIEVGVFTVLVLDLLMRVNAEDVARVLHCVDWKRVSHDCEAYEVAVPQVPSVEAIQTSARAIRTSAKSTSPVAHCRDCGALTVLEHVRLKWEIPALDEPLRTSALTHLCGEAASLARNASSLPADAVRDVAARLTMKNVEAVVPHLMSLVTASYSRDCRLFGTRHTLSAIVSAAEAVLLTDGDSPSLRSDLRRALKCAAHGEVEISL